MAKRHLYLQWDSIERCNLRCNHCYHGQEGNQNHEQRRATLDLEQVCSMFDDLQETALRWGMVPDTAISGGECLMRPDLLEILEHTKEKKIITKLLTNGTLLTPRKAKEINRRGIDRLQISLDGGEALHNQVRGFNWAYDKALEGIRNATDAGIGVNVAMTLMQSNKNHFEDVIKAAINSGAVRVGFKTYVPSESGAGDPEFVSARDFYGIVLETEKLKEKYASQIKVLTSDVLFQVKQEENGLIKKAKEEGTYLAGCSAGFRALSVLSDGIVYPCRRLPIEVGHISQGISEIFVGNSVMQNLRDLQKIKESSLCDKVVHCRGCRAVAFAVTGDYMAPDPMCYKNLLPKE